MTPLARLTWRFILVICLFRSLAQTWGGPGAQWQIFPIEGNSPIAVSVSPRGKVWVKQADTGQAFWFTGYTNGSIQMPSTANFRIYESRSGQLWTAFSEGVWINNRGNWNRHVIPDMQAYFTRNPLRQLRQIAMVPADLHHAFILLPDRLLEYDSLRRVTTVIKLSQETALGPFAEMRDGPDGALWVTAERGVARIAGPLRRISREVPWTEYLPPPGLNYRSFLSPLIHPDGQVTFMATERATNERALARLDEDGWTFEKLGTDKLRHAWAGWDGSVWGMSFTTLMRREQDPGKFVREGVAGAQYDLAVQPNGVFWVACSEGLVRYAPIMWRRPAELEPLESPVYSLARSSNGTKTWFVTPEGLGKVESNRVSMVNWPEDFELYFQSWDNLHILKDETVIVTSMSGALSVPAGENRLNRLTAPDGNQVRVLASLRNGSLLVRSVLKSTSLGNLLVYDGLTYRELRSETLLPDLTFGLEMENGDVYLATPNSLFLKKTNAQGELLLEEIKQGLAGERILSLHEVAYGRLWAGTQSKVFELMGDHWELVQEGFDRVHSIQGRINSTVWVGTGRGLHRFVDGTWVENDRREGLQSSTIYKVIKDDLSKVWAASGNGVSHYYQDADPDPPRTLIPILENLETGSDGPVAQFHGVDKWRYTPAGSLLFSYRVNSGAWSPYEAIESRSFEELGPGTHYLEVRSMDRNGNKDPDFAQLEFMVVAPWSKDPRLITVLVSSVVIMLFLAGLAVNRHVRLRRSYAEVEKIVAQRTLELERANNELLHSQKMRALGTLAAGIAHDFNNILSIIKGSAQIIESNVQDQEKIQTRVERIKHVVEQGTGIVRSMLGLGRATEDLKSCDLNETVEEALGLLGDRIPATVAVRTELSPSIPPLICSKDMLQQMLLNFILNAIDAVHGTGEISAHTRVWMHVPDSVILKPNPAQGYVAISIRDTGSGIAPDDLPRIFEPFYTTKAFSNRRGTGLGLSMVYELAKSQGYGLEVQSELRKGSAFTIWVPFHHGMKA